MALFCECINITLLTYQHTTDHCIIHFVALEVIMDVSNFYAEAMMENKLKEFVEEAPKPVRDKLVKVEGTDDEWREMTDEDDEETCEWRYKRGSDQSFG